MTCDRARYRVELASIRFSWVGPSGIAIVAAMLLAWVWHYWLGVGLVIGAGLTILSLVVGYLLKVQAPQYPKRNQQQ